MERARCAVRVFPPARPAQGCEFGTVGMTDDMRFMRPVLCIVGPTAAGKSDLAQAVARALDGEVVSADSMQVYRGMDIGTGKVLRLAPRISVDRSTPFPWGINRPLSTPGVNELWNATRTLGGMLRLDIFAPTHPWKNGWQDAH